MLEAGARVFLDLRNVKVFEGEGAADDTMVSPVGAAG